jgi:hypothetical protein
LVFVLIAALSTIVALLVAAALPETLPSEHRSPIRIAAIWRIVTATLLSCHAYGMRVAEDSETAAQAQYFPSTGRHSSPRTVQF